ncbi:MAG: YdeI/OmpD-associated family protein [Chitinophagales bacterium]
MKRQKLKARIEIIGINPHVLLPDKVLKDLFKQAGIDKGPIRIKGIINDQPYQQTLVKFRGAWRLYINMKMLKNSPKRIGEIIELTVAFDPEARVVQPHPKFIKALTQNKKAKAIFDGLRPSLQHEIVRYISHLRSEESIDRNVSKAIEFLLGRCRFVGRDRP